MSADVEARYRSRLVQAASALQEMKAQVDQLRRAAHEPIAVIGMGCRFPGGASDPERYWRLLADGADAVSEVPAERAALHDDPGQPDDIRWGAFLDGVDQFDAEFFGISPREAAALDPQQRLLMEVAWEAIEDAGVVPNVLRGSSTGVFAGITGSDYLTLSMAIGDYDAYTGTGATHCFGPGRLSYHLGLQGPCLAVDTACSSSLVALHLAVRSLRAGECALALAGGVNLALTPAATRLVARLDALSPDGRCRAFDSRANGFVRGEGCGFVVLKRHSDAAADGDRILALIRGTAVNQDGASAGLTAPNPLAQRDLIRMAHADAGVDAADVTYVETHGTGTTLGDPIELEALTEAFGETGDGDQPCALGAVKTNIGHLEAAAGIAGVIKTVLALQHETVPANLHFEALNPRIDLDRTRFVIPDRARPWPAHPSGKRVAGVSSFGMSGTNAHAVVAGAPRAVTAAPPPEAGDALLIPVSARSPAGVAGLARAYASFLRQTPEVAMQDVAYTASLRRTHHPHRLAAVGSSRDELATALDAAATPRRVGRTEPRAGSSRSRPVFVFSGQGAQWPGMGCGLLESEPAFAEALAACDAALAPHLERSIIEELSASESDSCLAATEVAQPALFALQVALTTLLRSWGVEPAAVIGHSLGEIAAAHVAGALTLDDAAALVATRGRVMRLAAGSGGMLAVGLAPDRAEDALDGSGEVSIAAINAPEAVVLAGPDAALEEITGRLRAEGVFCRALSGSYAFHSPAVAPLAGQLADGLDRLSPREAALPIYSTVTAERVDGAVLDSGYWAANMREPVRFAHAVTAAIEADHRTFVEVASHRILSANVSECLAARRVEGAVISTLRRAEPERACLLGALGDLHVHGHPVDFAALHPDGGRVVSLPTYRWQRRRHWLSVRGADQPPHPDRQPVGDADPSSWLAELLSAPPEARRARLQDAVRADVASVLGLASADSVPLDQPLLEVGLDSLMAVQVRHELAARTDSELPSTLVFDHPTVAEIATYLNDTITETALVA